MNYWRPLQMFYEGTPVVPAENKNDIINLSFLCMLGSQGKGCCSVSRGPLECTVCAREGIVWKIKTNGNAITRKKDSTKPCYGILCLFVLNIVLNKTNRNKSFFPKRRHYKGFCIYSTQRENHSMLEYILLNAIFFRKKKSNPIKFILFRIVIGVLSLQNKIALFTV